MKANRVKKELKNRKKITCVADYLAVLKKEVHEVFTESERFFRGLSKTQYIESDYPSIYRSPDNDPKYEPYIKYEHEMFYDFVSRFPEQFSSCKNTFEHLVMMQHYGFPTRLLDVTSNPLVALYFACVDRHGEVNKNEDGAVTIYDIPNRQIKNYNSDTVTILSNLARIDEAYKPVQALYNRICRYVKENKFENMFLARCKDDLDTLYDILEAISKYEFNKIIEEIKKDMMQLSPDDNCTANLLSKAENRKKEYFNKQQKKLKQLKQEIKNRFGELHVDYEKTINDIKFIIKRVESLYLLNKKADLKFKQVIQEEKSCFTYEDINYSHLKSFFCVKPKLNNPRIINQNGAFLLFGFADQNSTKLEPPVQHLEKKATKKKSDSKINIIIQRDNKKTIVDELKQLGIHRASLFPEIDKVAQVVVSEYNRKK